jgi:hypothetical protein
VNKAVIHLTVASLIACGSAAIASEDPPLRDRVRRVVTGESADGRSSVIRDGGPPRVVALDSYPGFEMVEIWATEEVPQLPLDRSEPTIAMDSFVPPAGGTRFRLTQIPPDTVLERVREGGGSEAEFWREFVAKVPGLAESHELDRRGLRQTGTVDYVIVLEGELWLELDDGSTTRLRQGDVLVQNAPRYAWRNPGEQPCVIAEVLVGAVGGSASAGGSAEKGEGEENWKSKLKEMDQMAEPSRQKKGTAEQ